MCKATANMQLDADNRSESTEHICILGVIQPKGVT